MGCEVHNITSTCVGNESMPTLLASAYECPFAQRTWTALLEKGVEFEVKNVELRRPEDGQYEPDAKPDWLMEMNPLGKVPALQVNGECVYESLVCNEYVEEAYPGTRMAPEEAMQRAKMRLIMARFESRVVPKFYKLLLAPGQSESCISDMLCEFKWLESMLVEGMPYFMGPMFSLVELALLPFFARFNVLKHYRGFSIPENGDFNKLLLWYKTAALRPSFQMTCREVETHYQKPWDDCMVEIYARYADGTALSTSAKEFK